MPALPSGALRAWRPSSKHSSVHSSEPSPSTSMAPPSSTTRARLRPNWASGSASGAPSWSATASPASSSGVIFVARPAVEFPLHERGFALLAGASDHAERQEIARPRAVRGQVHEVHLFEVHTRAAEYA